MNQRKRLHLVAPACTALLFFQSAVLLRADPQEVELTSIKFLAGCTQLGCGGEFAGTTGTSVQNNHVVGGSPLNVFCIDYQNDVFVPGQPYAADFTMITNGSDLSKTRFGRTQSQWDDSSDLLAPINFTTTSFFTGTLNFTPTQLQRYQMVAWLTQQYTGAGSTADAIQSAIWQVTDNTPPPADGPEPYDAIPILSGSGQWLQQAAAFVYANATNDAYWNQFRVVTNTAPIYMVGQNPAQEFLTVVPEPLFPFAVVIGIVGLAAYFKRNRFGIK